MTRRSEELGWVRLQRIGLGAALAASTLTTVAFDSPAADPDAIRIIVESDGPVVVTGAELAIAGWTLADVDPDSMALSEGGRPVALRYLPAKAAVISTGAPTGRSIDELNPHLGHLEGSEATSQSGAWSMALRRGLLPEDRIEFVGAAHHDEFTDAAVYWLEPDGPPARRLRMGIRNAAPIGGAVTRTFTESVRLETDSVYLTAYRPEGGERWVWDGPLVAGDLRVLEAIVHTGSEPDRSLPVDGQAEIRVFIQGHTDDPAISPDHHLRLLQGGETLAEIRFDGRSPAVLTSSLPATDLAFGSEPPVLQSLGVGAIVDSVFLDRVELDYPAALEAVNGSLQFELPGPGPASMGGATVGTATVRNTEIALRLADEPPSDIRVGGFSSADITVVDATDPLKPVVLSEVRIEPDSAGSFAVRFAGASGTARYVTWRPEGTRPPSRIDRGRTIEIARDKPPTAEHVIITHRDLAPAAEALAAHRTAGGLTSVVVTTDDIYDTFSHGRFDPNAIGLFLAAARPRYALLIGEASLDHRGGYAAARSDPNPPRNLVPSLQVELEDGSVATSDLPYADFDGDGVPEIRLGRLPGSTQEEVRAVVAKLIAFEGMRPLAPPETDDWRRRSLFVTDDAASEVESVADGFAEALAPLAPDAERIFANRIDASTDVRERIRSSIGDGRLVVAYVGHGNVDTWAPWRGGGRLLRTADVVVLSNAGRLPILLTATCMNGWFDHPLKKESIAEAWLANPDGGGIAAWSPTSLARLPGQAVLLHAFIDSLAKRPTAPLGDLVVEAMSAAITSDPALADTVTAYAFFGDPATTLFKGGAYSTLPEPPVDGSGRADRGRLWLPSVQSLIQAFNSTP